MESSIPMARINEEWIVLATIGNLLALEHQRGTGVAATRCNGLGL